MADSFTFGVETVDKVEERFTSVYNIEKVGAAKVESQMEPERVSTGWWIVLRGLPIALRAGNVKPDIAPGDVFEIALRRITRATPKS
jgi:hypothetical protein